MGAIFLLLSCCSEPPSSCFSRVTFQDCDSSHCYYSLVLIARKIIQDFFLFLSIYYTYYTESSADVVELIDLLNSGKILASEYHSLCIY